MVSTTQLLFIKSLQLLCTCLLYIDIFPHRNPWYRLPFCPLWCVTHVKDVKISVTFQRMLQSVLLSVHHGYSLITMSYERDTSEYYIMFKPAVPRVPGIAKPSILLMVLPDGLPGGRFCADSCCSRSCLLRFLLQSSWQSCHVGSCGGGN